MDEFTTSNEEERLIARLRRGLEESEPVPTDVGEFARAAFSWRDIDADLAELEFDSVDEEQPVGVRSSATARMVSFQAGQWMLDVEHDPIAGRLIGAISPRAEYRVELHTAGAVFTIASDDAGRFEADGVNAGPLSMILHFNDRQVIKTQWVVLY
jgi:hypothetical protein